jgi:hypothetical protein
VGVFDLLLRPVSKGWADSAVVAELVTLLESRRHLGREAPFEPSKHSMPLVEWFESHQAVDPTWWRQSAKMHPPGRDR